MIGLYDYMLLIENLSFSFPAEKGKNPIFIDLSMKVKQGEFVSVIGASGSGKSTLFKLISGLLQPVSGSVAIKGVVTKKILGKVGYMPQKDLLMPWRTLMGNMLLPAELSRSDKKRSIKQISEWIDRFGLTGYENAYPHELSGGMKQRAAFLRTIMTGKDLLLLDEPFGALDSMTKRSMQTWLLDLWEELEKTVIFITHDLEEAILLSDKIYILGKKERSLREIKVEFPRPRTPDLIYDPLFLEKRKELERLIQHEGQMETMEQ
ncbi:putative hydroxymethylpyrimidine transport system ATP-binding protein [Bacillus sp. OV322]|uniref:ABC transporter ATP-binding protein n=1 Tax=Bacillus sp. OV322 TaxID=1882764 RepID=UPI0008F193AA|nr:ABC transporter ATP-binding protein [Bacillus sp. OV322]SFC72428.1 putative hydroxymethylpyrimidine transport system ATP-binding protein [Bacillus sp. OV322]